MLPYFSVPFSYDYRNSMQAMPQIPMQEAAPGQSMMPMQPMMPVQQAMPMQPMMPIQQAMPAMQCPILQQMNMSPQNYAPMMPGMMEMMDMDGMMGTEGSEETSMPEGGSRENPILSNNPPTTNITLFKELTGYPNYGNPSGNADILYTGNRGTWTFALPSPFTGLGTLRAQIVIRAVLDDHDRVPVDRYSARITINGSTVHTGRVSLEHGRPTGGRFNNWRQLTFNIPNLRRNNQVVIVNTSNTGPTDFIAFDWMEMRFFTR